MQEKNLFEYAVLRIVPRVEREEFLNVGIILYCAKQKFLNAKFNIDKHKLAIFCSDVEIDTLKDNLTCIVNICEGKSNSGPIGVLDLPSRFRWLTAKRSTIIQASAVHPGFCDNPAETLDDLFDKMVL